MKARKPESDIERAFLAVVEAHAGKIKTAYGKCVALSDKYGIPFGSYVPKKFKQDFYAEKESVDSDGNEVYTDGVDLDWAGQICPVGREMYY